MPRARRSSVHVSLVLIGAAALPGCGEPPGTSRDFYVSEADCRRDWNRPEDCNRGTHAGHGGFVWFGPPYASSSPAPRSPRALGTDHVTRSGFGSTSAWRSSGG